MEYYPTRNSIMNKDNVRRWLYSKGYNTRGRGHNITHVCLDGGSFEVPDNEHSSFLKNYKDALDLGQSLYFVEMKTALFRMFVDIDLKDTRQYESSEVEDISKNVVASLDDVFNVSSRAIICTTPPKQMTDLVKTGIHIITDIVVDSRHAKLAGEKIAFDLEKEYGPREEGNSWNDVVDPAVYRENATSLRMKGSKKRGDNRIYTPSFEICNGATTPIKDPFSVEVLEKCSVRLVSDVSPTPMDMEKISEIIKEREEADEINKKHKLDGDMATVECDDLVKFLKHSFPQHNIRDIRKISRVSNKNAYVILVESKYCLNVGKEHNSNNVYFYINRHGISQRCFCTCNTTRGRKFGKCGDFRSDPIPLSNALKSKIFPPSKNKQNVQEQFTNVNANTLAHVKSMEYLNSLLS